jgi:drug/metabolite transporter (DMT)-like permease
MSVPVFLAVLAAAFLHAAWNALIKTGTSKQSAMLILSFGHAICGAGVALWKGWLPANAVPWALGSGLIHMCYQTFLSYAYDHGDLSRVYPIARGAAPMLVLVISAAFLSDRMEQMELIGVLILGLGILLMARGVFISGESRKMLPFALGSAIATAGYSITDGMGARAAGDAVQYVGWLMIISAIFYTPAALALKGRRILFAPPRAWAMGLIAASASFGAYAIAVWAMTKAPIALVAALRETSILFAVLIGWLAFGERMGRDKWIAIAVILTGVIVTRL